MRRLGTPSAFEGPRPGAVGAGGEEVPLLGSSVLEAQTPRAPAAPLLPRARPGRVRTPTSLMAPRPRHKGSFPKGWRGARAHSRAGGSRRAVRIRTSAWWSGQGNCKSSSARPTLTRHASQGGCEGHLFDPEESFSPLRVVAETRPALAAPLGEGNPELEKAARQPQWSAGPQGTTFSSSRKGDSESLARTPRALLPQRNAGTHGDPGLGSGQCASLPDLMEL